MDKLKRLRLDCFFIWRLLLIVAIVFLGVISDIGRTDENDSFIAYKGWLTGNEFLRLPVYAKGGYVIGFVDGIYFSPVVGASIENISWLNDCLTGMDYLQLFAILEKYLSENPAKLHYSVHSLAYSAMNKACKHNK